MHVHASCPAQSKTGLQRSAGWQVHTAGAASWKHSGRCGRQLQLAARPGCCAWQADDSCFRACCWPPLRAAQSSHLCIVVLPHFACNLVTTQIKCLEVDTSYLQLLRSSDRQCLSGGSSGQGLSVVVALPPPGRSWVPHATCLRGPTMTDGSNDHQQDKHASLQLPLACLPAAAPDQAVLGRALTSEVGICVGCSVTRRSSLSMCIKVVLPALSRPCTAQSSKPVLSATTFLCCPPHPLLQALAGPPRCSPGTRFLRSCCTALER